MPKSPLGNRKRSFFATLLRVGTFLILLEGVRTKLVGESKVFAAAANDIPGLGVIGYDDLPVTARATGHLDHRCDHPRALLPQPERECSSERTVDDVAWLDIFWKVQLLPTIRARDGPHLCHIPSNRWSFPRSNPTITSPSTTITGVARRPVFSVSSCRASGSSATFRSVKGTL